LTLFLIVSVRLIIVLVTSVLQIRQKVAYNGALEDFMKYANGASKLFYRTEVRLVQGRIEKLQGRKGDANPSFFQERGRVFTSNFTSKFVYVKLIINFIQQKNFDSVINKRHTLMHTHGTYTYRELQRSQIGLINITCITTTGIPHIIILFSILYFNENLCARWPTTSLI